MFRKKNLWIVALLMVLAMVFIGCDEGGTSTVADDRPLATEALTITDADAIGKLLSAQDLYGTLPSDSTVVSTNKNVAHINLEANPDNYGFMLDFSSLVTDVRYKTMEVFYELTELTTTIPTDRRVKIGCKEVAAPLGGVVDMKPYDLYELYFGTPTEPSKVGDKGSIVYPIDGSGNKAPKQAIWFLHNQHDGSGVWAGKGGAKTPLDYKLTITKIFFDIGDLPPCCTDCNTETCAECVAGNCENKCYDETTNPTGSCCKPPFTLDALKALSGGIPVTPAGDKLPTFDSTSKVSSFDIELITPAPTGDANMAKSSAILFTWEQAGIADAWAAAGEKQKVEITYGAVIESGVPGMSIKKGASATFGADIAGAYPNLEKGPSTKISYTKAEIGADSDGLTIAHNSWKKPDTAKYHIKVLSVTILDCPDCGQNPCVCLDCGCFCEDCVTAEDCDDGDTCDTGCTCDCHVVRLPSASVTDFTVTFADAMIKGIGGSTQTVTGGGTGFKVNGDATEAWGWVRAMFELDLVDLGGPNVRLSDYDKVTFTYKGTAGDTAGYKDVSLVASTAALESYTAAYPTYAGPTQFNFGALDDEGTFTLAIDPAKAFKDLKGASKIWVGIFYSTGADAEFEISNVQFIRD